MAILPVGIGSEEASYRIERSLRFNSADSAYLSRTPASAGNRKTWTWSGWVKRSTLGSVQAIFSCGTNGATYHDMYINSDDTLRVVADISGTPLKYTTQVFRDVGAWYHIVNVFDTTNATAGDRWRLYVNGVRITAFGTSTDPSLNADGLINSNSYSHAIGQRVFSGSNYYSGYMTEVHFIDGSALDPTSFGEYNSETGVWQPKAYTGSYGTNGFYLDFADNSSTTALGYDAAGSNDWTPNNFSVTAGAGNDSLVDTPTPYGTDTGAGGEVRGNYCTLNPLDNGGNTLSNGNLDYVGNGDTTRVTRSTFAMPTSGKWYVECRINSLASNGLPNFGIVSGSQALTGSYTGTTLQIRPKGADSNYPYWVIDSDDASKRVNTTPVVAGTIIQLIYDADLGKVWMGVNNTYYGISSGSTVTVSSSDIANGTNPAYTLNSAITYFTCIIGYTSSDAASVNFGQRPFAYTAPSGFKALCTQNLPEPTVVDGSTAFNTVLWTGNTSTAGVTQAISGVGFQPDFLWAKTRNQAFGHYIYDSIRGVGSSGKRLNSAATTAEATNGEVDSFDSDGFTVKYTDTNVLNWSSSNNVGWAWKAGGTGVSNTDGSITSTVSANTTAGFSIVTYTGNGTAGATVGHGLGVAPSLIIAKGRGNVDNWPVGHTSRGWDRHLLLNTTAAEAVTSSSWNNTAPTSTVFTVGTDTRINQNTIGYVAYCFSAVSGYSAFGSYTGNGSTDGPFVYTGFRPRYVMWKISSGSTGDWYIVDSVRDTYNVASKTLWPNLSNAEGSGANLIDFVSNGFKVRNAGGSNNGSGYTFIYAAFAENPFKYSLGR